MAAIENARKTLLRRILEGKGSASPLDRRAAFENHGLADPVGELVNKVARNVRAVSDEDIAMAKRSGRNEDQLFEVIVCAAVGEATRQYEAAKAALDIARRDSDAARMPR
jgi:hypothetical protein